MYKKTLFLIALVGAFSGQAHAISKCTGADGKVVFQDTPCEGKGGVLNVRPASGHGNKPEAIASASASSAPGKPQTEAQKMTARAAVLNADRRIRELEQISIPNAKGEIVTQRNQCDAQIKELQTRKQSANNNLAGATWEGSLSQEMTAVATRCDTKDRQLKDSLEAHRKECQALGGCR